MTDTNDNLSCSEDELDGDLEEYFDISEYWDDKYKELDKRLTVHLSASHLRKNIITIVMKLSKKITNNYDLSSLILFLDVDDNNNWIKFMDTFNQCCKDNRWSKNTQLVIVNRIKLLLLILIPKRENIIKRAIHLNREKKPNEKNIYPKMISKLPKDDKFYLFYEYLRTKLLIHSKQKSLVTQKMTFNLWHNIFVNIGLFEECNELNDMNEIITWIKTKTDDDIINSYKKYNEEKKYNNKMITKHHKLINTLFCNILKSIKEINIINLLVNIKNDIIDNKEIDDNINDENVDKDLHRFTADEIQRLNEACQSTMEKLIFNILFTTGMRVGGLANIKVKNIAILKNGAWECKNIGNTIEKGNKLRTFPISELVKPHLIDWLKNHREITTSPYLFPSKKSCNRPMQTNVFQKIFKQLAEKANITGKNAHIHAIRHTVGFLMSELGNNIEAVAKFLDHSTPMTTQKYYVKYSCNENMNRMSVPWFDKKVEDKVEVPKCLINEQKQDKPNQEDKPNKKKVVRQKIKSSIQALIDINKK
jgi:integrase